MAQTVPSHININNYIQKNIPDTESGILKHNMSIHNKNMIMKDFVTMLSLDKTTTCPYLKISLNQAHSK